MAHYSQPSISYRCHYFQTRKLHRKSTSWSVVVNFWVCHLFLPGERFSSLLMHIHRVHAVRLLAGCRCEESFNKLFSVFPRRRRYRSQPMRELLCARRNRILPPRTESEELKWITMNELSVDEILKINFFFRQLGEKLDNSQNSNHPCHRRCSRCQCHRCRTKKKSAKTQLYIVSTFFSLTPSSMLWKWSQTMSESREIKFQLEILVVITLFFFGQTSSH